MAVEREDNELSEAVRGLFATLRGELAAVKEELAAVKGEVAAAAADKAARQSDRGLVLEERRCVVKNEVNELRRTPCIGLAPSAMAQMTSVPMLLPGLLIALLLAAAIAKHGNSQMAGLSEAVGAVMASMAGAQEWTEAMETRMRALGVQVEDTMRELAAAKGELSEEARKGEDKMRAKLAVEREERRREVQELNWPRVMEELAICKEWQRIKDTELYLDLQISQSKGDRKTAWERIKLASEEIALNLGNLHILSDSIIGHVSTMTHLKSIDLSNSSGFSAENIRRLYRLPQLEKLNLIATNISDCALEGIGSLTSLKHLLLHNIKVTDAGLPHLTGLSSLKELWLSGCKGVTDTGMVHVGRLTWLERLALGNIADAGLQHLTGLTKLTALWPSEGGWIYSDDARRRIGM